MAYYLVRARAKPDHFEELRQKVGEKAFQGLRPFGLAITASLEGARIDPETGEAFWEEEDYCSPPLAMERAAVLDKYFTDLRVELVERDAGWAQIQGLPSLWTSDK